MRRSARHLRVLSAAGLSTRPNMLYDKEMLLRVLLVEDDEEMAELAQELFATMDIEAETRASVAAALEEVEAHPYDAVVTDLELTNGESGLALCQHLANSRPELVVVVMSGDSTAERAALGMGARGFFTKPVELSRVAALIRAEVEPQT